MALTLTNVTPWKDQVAPMAWRNGRIYYHKTGQGVVSEGYSALPDGTDERLETGSASYPAHTHQSIEDVSPDGRYVLVTVERSNHPPNADGYDGAAPGKGTYNDLWLLDLQSGSTWKIVDLLVTKNASLIWPRFNQDGTKIVWTELATVSWFDLGKWNLYVADLKIGTPPTLLNKRTYKGVGFIEAYGFDSNNNVLATVSLSGMSSWCPQICRIDAYASTITPKRLSPTTPDEAWPWANYCEFAYILPSSGRILFGRTYQAKNGSIEFWTMNQDGTDVQRLTYFSDPTNSQYLGATVILGGIAFDPENPNRFIAGYATDSNGVNMKSVFITIS